MAQPGNILVQACAGSGKTTTMVWLAGMIPAHMRVLALSFNKSIADELAKRMPAHVKSCTMHSIGYSMVRAAQGRNVRLDDRKLMNVIDTHPGVVIHQNGTRQTIISDLLAIVPLAQDCLIDTTNTGLLAALAEAAGRTIEMPDKSLPLVDSVIKCMDAMKHTITFTEMIRHPVIHNYPSDYYDVVFVDEAQDLNSSQHAMLKKLVRPINGKIIAVGDRFQSIYGFRGADPRSMDRLRDEWNMTELPLDVSYRCASSVIAEAQKIVGEATIKAKPAAEAGEVRDATIDQMMNDATEHDMILCRINAPLVPACLKFIKAGKTARIRGRDVGAMLSALVRRSKKATIPELIAWTVDWRDDRMDKARKARKSDSAIQAIEDQADTLVAIAEECREVAEVLDKLSEIFDDRKNGITLSTVHKAKGLEANRVYLFGPELLPAKWAKSAQEIEQERNITYVAVTRAMRSLVRVPLPPRRRD
jgi:DNA helicase-2/ATP-dependent DNA helicase PcrA